MAQNDIWRATMIQSVNNERIANVFFYEQQSSDSGLDPRQDLGDGLEATINPLMVTNLGTGWKALCYEITKVGVPGQQAFRVLSAGAPGVRLGIPLNAGTVATIAQFTATGSYRGTGRTFISGLTDEQINRNNLSAAGLTEVDIIGDALIQPLVQNGVTFQMGRYNKLWVPPFDPWILSDVRVPTTKLRSRRQSLAC